MSDLAATAERLRVVKQACQHFLALWATDRMWAPVMGIPESASTDDPIADPMNRDWSLLYRGSVLDD